jgi:hypothetical protein
VTVRAISARPEIAAHLRHCVEHYALKERVWAAEHGHTAVRLSRLCALAGRPAPTDYDKCIVLRGAVELTPQYAAAVLLEYGLG